MQHRIPKSDNFAHSDADLYKQLFNIIVNMNTGPYTSYTLLAKGSFIKNITIINKINKRTRLFDL